MLHQARPDFVKEVNNDEQLEAGGGQRPPKFHSIVTERQRSCGFMVAIKKGRWVGEA